MGLDRNFGAATMTLGGTFITYDADQAPSVPLPLLDGGTTQVTDHKGKPVIVTTYRAFW